MLRAVFVGVGEDFTADVCTLFAKVVTGTLLTWGQWDAREAVVGGGSGWRTVAVLAIGVRGGLSLGDGVAASFEVNKAPIARCIGGRRFVDSAACVCACQGHGHVSNAWFADILGAIVVVVRVDRSQKAGDGITEVADRWDHATWCDGHRQGIRGARAKTNRLGFNNRVIACGYWWEDVIAVCKSGGRGGLHAWGVWIGINIVARRVFQGQGHTWQTWFAWLLNAVFVAVYKDPTCNWCARLAEQVTRGISLDWQSNV